MTIEGFRDYFAFYLQTDGQYEKTIQMLEDMFRACVLEFLG